MEDRQLERADPGAEPRTFGARSRAPAYLAARARRALAAHRDSLVGLLAYVALAVLLTHDAWSDPAAKAVGTGFDPGIFIWDLRWTPYAIAHLHDPLLTSFLNAPAGVNLMWNTSILLPSLLMTPVTLAFGPVASYNALAVLALAGSAWTASLVLRRWARPAAAWAGGLLYGFNPFMVSESLGHPHITIAWFPPLVLAVLDDAVRGRRSPRATGVLLGLLAAAQLVTGEETLVLMAIAAVCGLVWLVIVAPRAVRERAPDVARTLAIGGVVALALGAIPLYVELLGPGALHGRLVSSEAFVLDLQGLFTPTWTQLLHTNASVDTANHWTGLIVETNGYLGLLPLLLLALVWFRIRTRVVLWAAGLAATLIVLAFGQSLHVGGRDTGLVLPWRLVRALPLSVNILPARMMLLVYLLLGLLLAVVVDRMLSLRGARRLLALALVAAALVSLAPTSSFPTAAEATPPFFRSRALERLPAGSIAMVTPHVSTFPMLWQAESDMHLRITGGYVFTQTRLFGPSLDFPDVLLRRLSDLDYYPNAPTAISPADRQLYLATLRGRRVREVLVGPSPYQARIAAFLATLLGRQPQRAGGVFLFTDVHA